MSKDPKFSKNFEMLNPSSNQIHVIQNNEMTLFFLLTGDSNILRIPAKLQQKGILYPVCGNIIWYQLFGKQFDSIYIKNLKIPFD